MAKTNYVKPGLDKEGREVPDPIPMAPPIGYKRQPSLTERIRDMVRSEHLRIAALEAGQETFEEADDFEVGDDFDPNSPYEEVFDPVDADARMRLRQEDYAASVEARLGEMRPRGDDDGRADVEQGRVVVGSSGSGKSGKVGKGKSEPKQKSDDRRGVSEATDGDQGSDE